MTLRIRNRGLLALIALSAFFAAATAALYIYTALTSKIVPPTEVLRLFKFKDSSFFLFRYNFASSILATAVFPLYALFMSALIFVRFEKTQATEILYFSLFLFACLCEGARLFTPLFGLWKTYSSQLVFAGRTVVFGRFLAPMSLLLASIFGNFTEQQDSEKNMTIVVTAGAVFSMLLPINTSRVSSANTLCWGFQDVFFAMRSLIFLAALLSSAVRILSKNNLSSSYLLLSQTFWLSLTVAGYAILACADNFLLLFAGTGLLFVPTLHFLKDTHRLYS